MKHKPKLSEAPLRPWPPLQRGSALDYVPQLARYASPPPSVPSPLKGRDYYFLSPPYWRTATAAALLPAPPPPGGVRPLRQGPRLACPCSRSRSMDDVRADLVCEWEDAPVSKGRHHQPSGRQQPPQQQRHAYARRSVENLLLVDGGYHHVPQTKRFEAPFVSNEESVLVFKSDFTQLPFELLK